MCSVGKKEAAELNELKCWARLTFNNNNNKVYERLKHMNTCKKLLLKWNFYGDKG